MKLPKKILCVGDLILDSYSDGVVHRISPEAPIPVLKVLKKDKFVMGGSGNVAKNITAAGSHCHLISVIGSDENGKILKELCNLSDNLSYDLLIDPKRITTRKHRFVSGNQQILRVDSEFTDEVSLNIKTQIYNKIKSKINLFSVIVLSDYNKGVFSRDLVKKIINLAKKNKIKIIVDPKRTDFSFYRNANIITPNLKELSEAVKEGKIGSSEKNIERLSKKILKLHNFETVITTKSSNGISIINRYSKSFHLPSKAKEVYDVSGAGDTVVAYIAVGESKHKNIKDSVEFANEAAGVAVGKFGTSVVSKEEVIQKIGNKPKVCTLQDVILELKEKRINVGFTNGCFDLLHQGHIDYLKKSKNKCDFLILGLNSDTSIKKIKGSGRPILNQNERSQILSSFDFIDRIIIFNEVTPIKLIKKIKPKYIFKGDDYTEEQVIGNKEIKEWAGKVILIKCVEGKSTSKIIERIKNGS